MSKKRIVTSEPELLSMIDRLRDLKVSRRLEAGHLEALAQDFFKRYGLVDQELAKLDEETRKLYARKLAKSRAWKERAEKLRQYEDSTTRRIKRFGAKLAELRTGILPGIETGIGVEV